MLTPGAFRSMRVDALRGRAFIPGMSGIPEVEEDERNIAVPLFGSWRKAYVVVVAAFLFDVAAFYAIGRYFA